MPYAINEYSNNPIFPINQHIGFHKDVLDENGDVKEKGGGQGIDGVQFLNEVLSLNEYPNIDRITFLVNCVGGDVKQSVDIFTAISQSKQKTYALISGFAYSCGGWIPLAADRVEMVYETGSWMCHMPYDPSNPDEKSDFMDAVIGIVSKAIAVKTGRGRFNPPKKTPDEIKALMFSKTYWDAERMEKEGLIDKIVYSDGKKANLTPIKDKLTDFAINSISYKPFYKEYQTALNKEISKINSMASSTTIIERLNAVNREKTGIGFNLTSDASEHDISAAIARLENFIRVKNDDMMDMKNLGEKAVKERKLEQESAVSNMEEMSNKIKEAENKAKEAIEALDKLKMENAAMCAENKNMKENVDAENKAKADSDLLSRQNRAKDYISDIVFPKPDMKTFWEAQLVNNWDVAVNTLGMMGLKKVIIQAPKSKSGKKSTETREIKNSEDFKVAILENVEAENYAGISEMMTKMLKNKIESKSRITYRNEDGSVKFVKNLMTGAIITA